MATQAEIEAIIKMRDELTAKVQKMTAEVNKLAGGMEKGQSKTGEMQKGFAELGSQLTGLSPKMFSVAGGIVAVGAAMAAGIRMTVQMGDRITNLARQFQMSTDAVQRLEAGGRGLGISFEQLGMEASFLEKTLGSRSEGVLGALEELGLSYTRLSKMSPEQRLLAVHRAVAQISDPLRQAAVGAELLGRGFQKMTEAELDEFEKEMNAAVIASKEAIDAGDKLGDAWDKLKASSLSLVANGLLPVVSVLGDIIENLNFAIDRFSKYNQKMKDAGFGNWSPEMGGSPAAKKSAGGFVGPMLPPGIADARDRARDTQILAEEKAKKAAAKATEKLGEEAEKAANALSIVTRQWTLLAQSPEAAIPNMGGSRFPGMLPTLPEADYLQQLPISGRFTGKKLSDTAPGVDFSSFGKAAEVAQASLGDLSMELANLAHMADVVGPKWAAVFQGLSSALAGASSIGGGIKSIQGGGFMNTIAGLGGIASGIGAIVAPIISILKGLGGPDIGRDVGRDIGANISKELEKAIEESGQNAQMFLREIFEEGGLGIDRFAEEVGDLFSMFERGEISESGLLGELQEVLPILIENFGELGDVGQEQIMRILGAAEAMGIELGAAGDALERLAAGIPETTLEGMAEQLGISVEKARELAELMGVTMQTDLERLADDLDIPVDKLQELGEKLKETFGINIEDVQTLLDAMGITIEDLAEKLGVELPAAAAEAAGAVPEEGAPLDPQVFGNTAGGAIADRLMPGQKQLGEDIAAMRADMGRIPQAMAQAVRDAMAQLT